MGRSSRPKENYEKGSTVSEDDNNEGTAARTRSFSYDEIILRRKVKLPDSEKHEPAIQTPGDIIVEKAPDRYRSERGYGHNKNIRMSDLKFSSENRPLVERSKRKDRDTYKDDYIAKAVDRDVRDVESMLVATKNKDIRMSDLKFSPEDRPVVERSKPKDRDTYKDDYIAKAADRDIRDAESMSVATKNKDIRMSDLKFSSADRPVVERSKAKDRDTYKDDYIAKAAHGDIRDVESMSVATKNKDIRMSDLKFSSADRPVVERSKRKDRDTYKDDYIAKAVDRDVRDVESMSVAKKNKDTGTEPESRGGKNTDGRENSDKHYSNESRNEHARKQPRIMSEIHRDVDKNREKYEKENEDTHRNGVDKKRRSRNVLEERSKWKGHSTQVSERRESRELLKSNYEELKPKTRRQSRSKEHNDRRRQSVSRSPRSHRHAANDGKGHRELSSQMLDQRKSRKEYSESNQVRSARNVSSSDCKKHGASMSGLGGYSPRKRRTVPTDKTPSPPKRSPEKRRAKWDIAPKEIVAAPNSKQSGLLISNNDKSTSSDVLELVSSIQAATSVKLLPTFLSNVVPTIYNVPIDSVQLTQATRPARRLHLENLPTSASEKAVMEWLNHLMISSGVNLVQGTQPCISCSVHKEKGQAIVELLTPEDAAAALSLDGSLFSGSTINIRRPKEFVGMATGEMEKSAAATVAIGDLVADSPNKIFIGGISKVFSAKMVMDIASAFGSLKAFQFEKSHGHENQHAFLEYTDHSVTLKACAGLNGMKLGGQVITAILATPSSLSLDNREEPPFCGIPEHAKPLLESPTSFLVLRNVFNQEDLPSLDSSEVEEVVEDVRLECARFGTVKMVNVVKHGDCAISSNQSNGDLISAGAAAKLDGDETDGKAETVEEAVDAGDKSEGNVTEDERNQQGERGMVPEVPLFESAPHHQHVDSNSNLAATDVKEINEDEKLTAGEDLGAEGCREEEFKESVSDDMGAEGGAVDAVSNSGQTTVLGNKLTSSEDPEDTSIGRSVDDMCVPSEAVEEGNNVGQVSDPRNVSEPGSVFVEFARAEAACIAAHSLHGRLFDGRTVTVEYVPRDIYRARFPS